MYTGRRKPLGSLNSFSSTPFLKSGVIIILLFAFVKLFHVTKRHQNNLRPVIEANGDNTVPYSPADDHGGVFFCEPTLIKLWEETLIRSNQASNE